MKINEKEAELILDAYFLVVSETSSYGDEEDMLLIKKLLTAFPSLQEIFPTMVKEVM